MKEDNFTQTEDGVFLGEITANNKKEAENNSKTKNSFYPKFYFWDKFKLK